MTPRAGERRSDHHPRVVPVVVDGESQFRAVCSCGYWRQETNTKRENAVRAARRHVQEAQS